MNALIVLSVAALAACGNAQYFGYPGLFYNYPGLYSGAYPAAVTLKAAPETPTALPPSPPWLPSSPSSTLRTRSASTFGYAAGGPSSRAESRDAFGIVRGSYNYVDSEGKVQTQHYVADALGFRVSGTNLPVAPDAPRPPLAALPGPAPSPSTTPPR
nr:COPII coat assembly protein sec16-like [Penaeus vannamei]